MKTLTITEKQLEILKAVVSHVIANQEAAENELDIALESAELDKLEQMLFE